MDQSLCLGLNDYGIPLKQWILDSYPVQLDGFTSSFTWKLLSRLANFFRFESIPLPDVDSGLVSQYDDMINAVPYILDVLSSMSFGSDNDHASNHHSPSTPKAKKNWKKVQPLTKPCSNKKVDSRRLEAFSISVPGNNEDKERAITDVLRAAKAILMVRSTSTLPGSTCNLLPSVLLGSPLFANGFSRNTNKFFEPSAPSFWVGCSTQRPNRK